MPLESLLELVETLRVRIDTHGSALRQSEALTRYALIDPLLRELGWDTSDPDMVVPEYRSGAGSADYALLSSGSPAMMVEAKKLGTPLQGVLTQGIGYCITEGIEYFSVTDGQRWEVYETHKPVPIDEKRIASWDLKDTSLGEVCLKVLALWRPSVQSGYIHGRSRLLLSAYLVPLANLRAVTGQLTRSVGRHSGCRTLAPSHHHHRLKVKYLLGSLPSNHLPFRDHLIRLDHIPNGNHWTR